MTDSPAYIPKRYYDLQWSVQWIKTDSQLAWLFGGVLGILVLASVIGALLKQRAKSDTARATINNLNTRTRAWWKMCAIFALTLLIGRIGSLVLVALLSLLAL